jgi:hypothetical protein
MQRLCRNSFINGQRDIGKLWMLTAEPDTGRIVKTEKPPPAEPRVPSVSCR